MNLAGDLFSGDLIRALGWTLVHSLWQGGAVALFVGIVMLFLKKHSANLRYLVYSIGMVVILGLAMITFIHFYSGEHHQQVIISDLNNNMTKQEVQEFSQAGSGTVSRFMVVTRAWIDKSKVWFESNTPLLVILWLTGMMFFLLRYLGGIIYTQRLKHYKTYEVLFSWEERLDALKEKIGLKKEIRLLESALVKVPVVIGFFRPVILIPLGIIGGVPPAQLEAILLHELAHIFRRDYLVNVIQSLVEVIFFYHPAVWWISKNIRIEREHVCDDIALIYFSDPLIYIKALTNMQELESKAPALAAAITGKRRHLLNRIRRMADDKRFKTGIYDGFITTSILFMGILALTASAAISFEMRGGKILLPDFSAPSGNSLNYGDRNQVLVTGLYVVSSGSSPVTDARTVIGRKEKLEARSINSNGITGMPMMDTLKSAKKGNPANDSVEKEMQKARQLAEESYKIAMDQYKKAMEQMQLAENQKRMAEMQYRQELMRQQHELQQQSCEKMLREFDLFKQNPGFFHCDSIDTIIGKSWNWSFSNVPELSEMSPDAYEFLEMPSMQEMPCPERYEFIMPGIPCLPGDSLELFQFFNMPDSCMPFLPPPELDQRQLERMNRDIERAQRKIERYNFNDEMQSPRPFPKVYSFDRRPRPEHIIRQELLKDGLIKRSGDYVIELNNNGMYINGEKQTRDVAKKYKHLYESLEDESIGENNSFKLIL
jgi:beta-lactamase regulating signal transducer with metallopeptidase domain